MDVYVAPGQGASDALLDWLERNEIVARLHDVNRDVSDLAEGIALGGGRFPVTRQGDRVVRGFDAAALERLRDPATAAPGGAVLATDGDGRTVVVDVEPGGPAAAAGLMPGDVVIALGGYTIFNADSLAAALEGRTRARGRVRLQVRRADQVLEIALPSRGVAV